VTAKVRMYLVPVFRTDEQAVKEKNVQSQERRGALPFPAVSTFTASPYRTTASHLLAAPVATPIIRTYNVDVITGGTHSYHRATNG
jgi:hypothetical protein